MDSQDLHNLYEAYSNVYEQRIGVPLKDASDRAAKEQLKRMIPKGEKVYTPKATLQNAAYEPDAFDVILEYLVAEGYADTNDNALVIMANMSEEWRDSIVESIGTGPFSPDDKEDPRYDPERLIKHYWNSRIFRSKRPDELPTRSKEDRKKQKQILRQMRK